MKILLLGATGATGSLVLSQAIEQEIQVTAYVRSARKVHIQSKCLEVIEGQLSDIPRLEKALEGVDAVISALGGQKTPSSVLPSHYLPQILEAMKRKNVYRYIGISSGAAVNVAGDQKPIPARIMGKILSILQPGAVEDKRNEYKILESDPEVQWTLARPTRLLGSKLTRSYQVHLHRPRRLWVSRADVAHFLLCQLNDHSWIRKAPFVA